MVSSGYFILCVIQHPRCSDLVILWTGKNNDTNIFKKERAKLYEAVLFGKGDSHCKKGVVRNVRKDTGPRDDDMKVQLSSAKRRRPLRVWGYTPSENCEV